ncbi:MULTISPECIES: flavin reductase family protein [Bradyrhizobium]|uniref:flavin reductase family protein n=1 Tax=Bradyrhizobium TaxID=374 RepID=UPI001E48D975|nr:MULTISPECIES: iron-sulfur cluster-binding domain-containing protein [Bradyrhizobium]
MTGRAGITALSRGIGSTPLIGAEQALACRDADFTLRCAVSSREQAVYLDVLAPLLNERLIVHAGSEGRRLDFDGLFASLPPDVLTFLCGPIRMMPRAGPGPAQDAHYPTYATRLSAPAARGRPKVSGGALQMAPWRSRFGERSLLDVLNEAGYEVISDCRRGECGACAIDLVKIDGELDHHDGFFSE